MNKVLMSLAAGAFALSAQSVMAQEMTLAGAQALLTEIPGASDCSEPASNITIPDGGSSSEAQMNAAVGTFNQYNIDAETFRNCLDAAASNMGDGLTEQHNQAVTLVYDANASKVEALAASLQAEINTYKAANP